MLSPLTRGLLILLLIHGPVTTAVLHLLLGTPRTGTIVHELDRLAARSQSNDSWRPMNAARQYAATNGGDGMYQEIFFSRKMKFQYPPTSLLFVDGFSRPTLKWMSWGALWITVGVSVALFLSEAERLPSMRSVSAVDWWIRAAVLFGLSLTFYPVVRAYGLGQIQAWVNMLFALLVLGWMRGWSAVSGVMLGLMCLIKPTYAMLGIWALLRQHWRFAAAAGAAGIVGLTIAVAAFGATAHLEYLRVLSYVGSRGEAYFPNQSFNGVLNRLLDNGSNLVWQEDAFPPFHPVVYGGTLLLGLLLLAAAFWPVARARVATHIDLAVIAISATITSPLAWEHHFGVLLPLFAAAVPSMLSVQPFGRFTATTVAACFVLTGQYFEIAQRTAAGPFNILQSYVLFGALVLLAAAYRTRSRFVPVHS